MKDRNFKSTVLPCYDNRELSWLRFNERVLEQAEDDRVPLCERLTFLNIFQSNLDEFFMVRIGSLHDQMLLDTESRENKTNMTPGEQIEASLAQIRKLCSRRDQIYDHLSKRVAEYGIRMVRFDELSPESVKDMADIFHQDFEPLLSSFLVGKKQSFPFLKNKEMYAIAVLSRKTEKKQKIGIVPCDTAIFPRLIEIPGRKGCYMLSSELILHYIGDLFDGYKVISKSVCRITRNADIDADAIDDEDLNYRDHMAQVVKRRRKLCPVRMELSRNMEDGAVATLCKHLHLSQDRVFVYNSPLDYSFLGNISDSLRSHPELYYASRHPQNTPDIDENRSVISQVSEKDILLHYPYQSIRPFLRMLSEAARDPEVVSIKMTLYRLARDSKVVESLVEAAENGKQVDVLVELKARFDEENNIEWSRRLERAGCHVIYGIEHLKVHSKLCLITRKTQGGISYITQIGTGNYNEKTSRLYTDLTYMTSRPEIGEEAAMVFHALTLGETVDHVQNLMVAPHCLQSKLINLIDGEIAKANAGKQAHIRLKMNSLTDKALMEKLIDASCAGVKIDMIVRGICCLKGGVKGLTENIRIISIVGRFLEHSRIYMFGEGEEKRIYISSADWMTRNTLRRVEVACPILDEACKNRIENIFRIMWEDNASARDQKPDGTYERRIPASQEVKSCQNQLYDIAYRMSASIN